VSCPSTQAMAVEEEAVGEAAVAVASPPAAVSPPANRVAAPSRSAVFRPAPGRAPHRAPLPAPAVEPASLWCMPSLARPMARRCPPAGVSTAGTAGMAEGEYCEVVGTAINLCHRFQPQIRDTRREISHAVSKLVLL